VALHHARPGKRELPKRLRIHPHRATHPDRLETPLAPLFQVVATFEALPDGKTSIVFKMLFDTPEACEKIKRFAVEKNEENFDRLEEELGRMGKLDLK
jgi:hypothetical protein